MFLLRSDTEHKTTTVFNFFLSVGFVHSYAPLARNRTTCGPQPCLGTQKDTVFPTTTKVAITLKHETDEEEGKHKLMKGLQDHNSRVNTTTNLL